MEMKIGTKLTELRKKKGLTQNQLAEMLGVSAPTVSKWENESSYPDITLLCPLARALDTNVDTLLQFEDTISREEIEEKLNALLETTLQEGYEAGEELLLQLLHKYPNSSDLKYNASVVWDTFRIFFPTADKNLQEKWKNHKKELLTELRASSQTVFWQQATLGLAFMAVADGELARAEQLLDELPEHSVDSTLTRFQLYLKKDVMTGKMTLPKHELFSPGLEMKERSQTSSKEMRKILLLGIEDEAFKPLLAYSRCRKAIEKLKKDI